MMTWIASLRANAGAVKAISAVALACLALGSLLIDTHHAHTWVEQHVPFFWSLFAFAGSAALVGLTRWLGRSGIQTRPEVYGPSPDCDEEA